MTIELLPIAFVALALIFVSRAVKIVPQGYEHTVERFGRYTRTLSPGLHIIIPLVDRVGAKVNMMETVLDVPSQDVITRDNAVIQVDGVVFFQILDASKSAYEVNNLRHATLNLTVTNIRTVMGSMDLDELLSKREAINARLLDVVDEATTPWGTKVTRIEIKDIRPPKDLVDSMARQMKAERDKRALILDSEGEKQAEILAAEGERQGKILKAEGEKEAMILQAEGRRESAERDAKARERLAQAEARATLDVSKAIDQGNVQSVNYFVAQKYIAALQEMATAPNQKLMILPLEVTSVMGSIAGITELVKESFGGNPASTVKKPAAPSRSSTRG